MIRAFRENDLDAAGQIWLDANISAHGFIPGEYWRHNLPLVKEALPRAEVYVWEEGGRIYGFVGLTDNYISGIFVKAEARSRGIGKGLLDHAKEIKGHLSLRVYQKNARAVAFYLREGFEAVAEDADAATGQKELVMDWRP